MITTLVITFREFLEAFLVIGIFLGTSRKLHLKKEKDILAAAVTGIAITFILVTTVYVFGSHIRLLMTEANADLLEAFLLVFSGIFIAFVIFSLHSLMQRSRNELIRKSQDRLQEGMFDTSLFLTVLFLVLREAFEICLFTVSMTLLTDFVQSMMGLFIGFILSLAVSLGIFVAYGLFPLQKIFRLSEYLILLVGAGMTQHGMSVILGRMFGFDLSGWGSFGLHFLPGEDTLFGHLLQGMTGIDNDFSVGRAFIMILYALLVYFAFMRRKSQPADGDFIT